MNQTHNQRTQFALSSSLQSAGLPAGVTALQHFPKRIDGKHDRASQLYGWDFACLYATIERRNTDAKQPRRLGTPHSQPLTDRRQAVVTVETVGIHSAPDGPFACSARRIRIPRERHRRMDLFSATRSADAIKTRRFAPMQAPKIAPTQDGRMAMTRTIASGKKEAEPAVMTAWPSRQRARRRPLPT